MPISDLIVRTMRDAKSISSGSLGFAAATKTLGLLFQSIGLKNHSVRRPGKCGIIPNRTTRDPSVTLWRACDVRQVFDLTHVYDAFTPHNIGQYESRFLSFGISSYKWRFPQAGADRDFRPGAQDLQSGGVVASGRRIDCVEPGTRQGASGCWLDSLGAGPRIKSTTSLTVQDGAASAASGPGGGSATAGFLTMVRPSIPSSIRPIM